jgi:hypothetical protein
MQISFDVSDLEIAANSYECLINLVETRAVKALEEWKSNQTETTIGIDLGSIRCL